MLRLLVAGLIALLPLVAKADVFVIVPAHFAGTDGERVSDEIVRVIQNELNSQHRVLAPLEAAALVKKEERVWCRGGACAERYREAAGAVAAIVVRVMRVGEGAGLATSFQLGIQPSPGIEYTKGALLSDGPLQELAVKALREAMHEYRQGPGPWLEVTGGPIGATIYVDDREVGTLPRTLAVPIGIHRVRVEARTMEPMTKVVSFDSATDRERLVFHLEPERLALTSLPVRRSPADVGDNIDSKAQPPLLRDWRFWTGAVGLATSGWLVAATVRDKIRDGQCEELDGAGPCDRYREFGTRSRVTLGIGASLAAAGLALLGWRVFDAGSDKDTLSAGRESEWQAGATVSRGAFELSLRGRM